MRHILRQGYFGMSLRQMCEKGRAANADVPTSAPNRQGTLYYCPCRTCVGHIPCQQCVCIVTQRTACVTATCTLEPHNQVRSAFSNVYIDRSTLTFAAFAAQSEVNIRPSSPIVKRKAPIPLRKHLKLASIGQLPLIGGSFPLLLAPKPNQASALSLIHYGTSSIIFPAFIA